MRFNDRDGLIVRLTGIAAMAVVLLSPMGCVSAWWNSFLNPTELGNFRENVDQEILETISFRDRPSGIPNAVAPTPDDLVAIVEEYRIGPSDVLLVRMSDFLFRGDDTEYMLVVDDLGFIDVPQLGLVEVDGLTVQEVHEELASRGVEKGIYREDIEPIITVTVGEKQQRRFSISGRILYSGSDYPIPRSDFRLLDAINRTGGLDPLVRTVYVAREERRETRSSGRSIEPGDEEAKEERSAPPVTPDGGFTMMGAPEPVSGDAPEPATRPVGSDTLVVPPDEALEDLIEALTPPGKSDQGESESMEPQKAPGGEDSPSEPPFSYVPDSFEDEKLPDVPDGWGVDERPVDWQELASEGQQRIIRIPADRLRSFDSSYNIVIRHGDSIRLDPGPTGYFYISGHVSRPGSYVLQGQEMTLTQAIASGAGLDPLAWPTRCEIRRRIDQGREEITQWDLARIVEGKDPNIYIKPEDEINIGTHAIAPLLATIRNSFRLTYGFGFVYDRNFADIDAYYGQGNPEARRRTEINQRFPGLIP